MPHLSLGSREVFFQGSNVQCAPSLKLLPLLLPSYLGRVGEVTSILVNNLLHKNNISPCAQMCGITFHCEINSRSRKEGQGRFRNKLINLDTEVIDANVPLLKLKCPGDIKATTLLCGRQSL